MALKKNRVYNLERQAANKTDQDLLAAFNIKLSIMYFDFSDHKLLAVKIFGTEILKRKLKTDIELTALMKEKKKLMLNLKKKKMKINVKMLSRHTVKPNAEIKETLAIKKPQAIRTRIKANHNINLDRFNQIMADLKNHYNAISKK